MDGNELKVAGALNAGTYQGEENRLVGTEQVPLAELTQESVRARVERAAAEQLTLLLAPQAVSDFLEQHPRPKMRDVEGAG